MFPPQILTLLSGSCSHQLPLQQRGQRLAEAALLAPSPSRQASEVPRGHLCPPSHTPGDEHRRVLGGTTDPGAGTARPLPLPSGRAAVTLASRPGSESGKSPRGHQRQSPAPGCTAAGNTAPAARPREPRAHHLPNGQAADHREDDPADFDHQGLQNRAKGTAHHEGAGALRSAAGSPAAALPRHTQGAPHGTRAQLAGSGPARAEGAHPTSCRLP